MQFTNLPNELVLHIYQSCATIPSVLNLASTCHRFRSILSASQRLPTLYLAAEAQFGPLNPAIALVTHNNSQAAHLPRPSPPCSHALLTRLLAVGRVANQWATLYTFQKWRGIDSASRRLLTPLELHRLRRACYRLWLYALAFHTPFHPRTTRLSPPVIRTRAALLRSWSTDDLAEMLDLHAIFRGVLHTHICPSNGTVLRRHKARFPDDHCLPVLHNIHLSSTHNSNAQAFSQAHFHSTPHVSRLPAVGGKYHRHQDGAEGWGDEIAHYYVVEDMLKLDPGQLMWLYLDITASSSTSGEPANPSFTALPTGKGNTSYSSSEGVLGGKGVVERFVAGLGGEWFENNGETFGETVGWVVGERGGDMGEFRGEIEEGGMGICIEG